MTMTTPAVTTPTPATDGMRNFRVICFGQLISLFGSSLTAAALGPWVFEKTRSTTQFALVGFFATLPPLLLGPLAGAILDRTSRKRALLTADIAAGLTTALLALVLFRGELDMPYVYLFTFVTSMCTTFRWPALTASASLLAPKALLGRASAMLQGVQAIAYLASPFLGAVMLSHVGLSRIVVVDFVTFLVALASLVRTPIPLAAVSAEGQAMRGSLWTEMQGGMRFIASRGGLLGLLAVITVFNFGLGCVQAVLSPFLLSFTSVDVMGIVLSVTFFGMIVGTVVAGTLRVKRRVPLVLRLITVAGILLACIPLRASAVWVGTVAFLMMAVIASANALNQAVWMSKVPADIQGRVFTIRQMASAAAQPLAFAVAGPLVQQVFDPMFAGEKPALMARVLGANPSYGVVALIALVGLAVVIASRIASLTPRVRDLESDIQDAA
jgi:hypothetical protein